MKRFIDLIVKYIKAFILITMYLLMFSFCLFIFKVITSIVIDILLGIFK